MPLSPARRWPQQHLTTLAAAGMALAMCLSLAWQSADWLRLLREPVAAGSSAAQALAPTASHQHLAKLFGGSGRTATGPVPATDLRLVLLGSFVHADPSRSSAIIRSAGDAAQRYRVGSQMPGGIRLHAVYPERVEVERNGRRQRLDFPRRRPGEPSAPHPSGESASAVPTPLEPAETGNLAQLREQLDALRGQMEAVGALPAQSAPTDQPNQGD